LNTFHVHRASIQKLPFALCQAPLGLLLVRRRSYFSWDHLVSQLSHSGVIYGSHRWRLLFSPRLRRA